MSDRYLPVSHPLSEFSYSHWNKPDAPECQTYWRCVYCGKQVPDGCPDPAVFQCCGEVGHVEEYTEEPEEAAEREAAEHEEYQRRMRQRENR